MRGWFETVNVDEMSLVPVGYSECCNITFWIGARIIPNDDKVGLCILLRTFLSFIRLIHLQLVVQLHIRTPPHTHLIVVLCLFVLLNGNISRKVLPLVLLVFTHIHCRCVTFVLEIRSFSFIGIPSSTNHCRHQQSSTSLTAFYVYSIHGYRQILNCCGNIYRRRSRRTFPISWLSLQSVMAVLLLNCCAHLVLLLLCWRLLEVTLLTCWILVGCAIPKIVFDK